MKVFLGQECYYNFCDVYVTTVKVFDCEVKAFLWQEELIATENQWRTVVEIPVE